VAANEPPSEFVRAWEREESKVVRPFKADDDYLKEAAFRLYADADFEQGPVFHIDSIEKERLAPAVRLGTPPKDFAELVGIVAKDLSLLVSIEDRVFKNTVVSRDIHFDDIADGIIELGDDAVESASWMGDTRIHLAIVLTKNRKAAVGLAQRAGSWVAKKTFQITRTRDNANFSIVPVDENWFKSRGLPPSTTYYVDMLGADFNQPCDAMPELVKVYIAQSLNTALARDEESPIARALIKSIYVDVVTSILTVGFAALQSDVLPNSILDVVATRLTKATGVPEAKLMQFAKDNSGTQLQAIVQAEAELTRTMIAASGRRPA
jgi:hypothetical protein